MGATELLQQKALALVSFILKGYCGHGLPHDVWCLVLHFRDLIVATVAGYEPDFPPPCQLNLLFFPNLSEVRGKRVPLVHWTGIWNGTVKWKMDWNAECTQLQLTCHV